MSNRYVKPTKCKQPATSNKIWLHSKSDSKLTTRDSEEYNNLLDNGYFINRAEALGLVKTDETKGSPKTKKELLAEAKELGLHGLSKKTNEEIKQRIEDAKKAN